MLVCERMGRGALGPRLAQLVGECLMLSIYLSSFKLAKALGQDAIQILESDSQRTRRFEAPATKMADDQKEEKEGAKRGGRALFTGRSRDWRRGE